MSSILMSAMYLYMQERSEHSLLQPLYLWFQSIYMQERSVHSLIRSPIFYRDNQSLALC